MLEIVRGRTWVQAHTLQDSEDPEDLSDLSNFTTFRSQIRSKVATRNKKGVFEHPLIADVTVTVDGSVTTQTLTRAQTTALTPGEYLIDLVGIDDDGIDEALLEPEPVKVTNRPTSVSDLDLPPQEVPTPIPDFEAIFEEALVD